MNQNNFKPLLLLVLLLQSFSVLTAQQAKDTVYFDEEFSVCEQPVAEYYRVCTLNRAEDIFYKGEVEDYYINGQLKMKGDYSLNGEKNGEFIFYNKEGVVIKKGNFLNNEMFGDWYYYDSVGSLIAQFFCKSSFDFAPIILIQHSNDTILNNGKGAFNLNFTEAPYITSIFSIAAFEGHMQNGVKNGDFKYYTAHPKKLVYTEKFDDGRFIKGSVQDGVMNFQRTKEPIRLIAVLDLDLFRTDLFLYSNMVFGEGRSGLQKLVNYLQLNLPPQIQPRGEITFANDNLCFDVISKVLFEKTIKGNEYDIVSRVLDGNIKQIYYSHQMPVKELNNLKQLNGYITLNIDTTGKVVNCVFKINLANSEINKLTYYLQHVSNLAVKEKDGKKTERKLNLEITTAFDTLPDNLISARYILFNADSVSRETVINNSIPQSNAAFRGGSKKWLQFLEDNLNPFVPIEHDAPNGIYIVPVSFVVDTEGRVSDVKADNDPGYGTAKEAVRVIKKTDYLWAPSIKNGIGVKYRQKQNIIFEVSGQ